MLNQHYSQGSTEHQAMFEDIVIEAIQAYGQDIYYIPRKIVKKDFILNEEVVASFDSTFLVEMYMESFDGFEGDGKMLERFGIEVRDECVFALARKRWTSLSAAHGYEDGAVSPLPGDLIYLPLSKSLFEIRYVDTKKPFYQIKDLPTFRLTCQLFEYESQSIDTGIDEIDDFQNELSNMNDFSTTEPTLEFSPNETILFTLPNGDTGSTEFFTYELDEISMPNEYHVMTGTLTYDNGQIRPLLAGVTFVGVESGANATLIEHKTLDAGDDTIFKNDKQADNSTFAQEVHDNDFIDFTEENPFGEPFKF